MPRILGLSRVVIFVAPIYTQHSRWRTKVVTSDFVQDGDLHYLREPSNGVAICVAISPTQVTTRGAALYADGFYTRERFVATSTNETIPRTSVQNSR